MRRHLPSALFPHMKYVNEGCICRRNECYENVRVTRSAHDSNQCAANPKFLAVAAEVGGGGSFVVLPLNKKGRLEHR